MQENYQLTLEILKNQFENYRKNKSYNREPIPKHLWQAAEGLAKKHSIAIVSKELGLSYSSLKEQIYGPPVSKNKIKKKFPPLLNSNTASHLPKRQLQLILKTKKGPG